MAFNLEGINAHVVKHINREIRNSFTSANFMFHWLGLTTPDGMGGLNSGDPGSRPKAATVFGTGGMTKAQIETTRGRPFNNVRFVKAEPNDGAAVEYGGTTPVAAANATENFGTAEMLWTHIQEPFKINKHDLELARGEDAVGSIVDDAMLPVWERFVKRINQRFWTGTLTGAQQVAAPMWTDFLGFQHTGTVNNYYGKVNRAVETSLNPKAFNAATQFASANINLEMTRKTNIGFTDALGAVHGGIVDKTKNGTGATLWVTTKTLWQELAAQIDGRFVINSDGIPDKGIGGFRNKVIKFDDVLITWDQYCPSGEMHGFSLEYWMIEIQEGHNFTSSKLVDKAATEQGGEYILWGNFDAMLRLTCKAPDTHIRIYGLTVP